MLRILGRLFEGTFMLGAATGMVIGFWIGHAASDPTPPATTSIVSPAPSR